MYQKNKVVIFVSTLKYSRHRKRATSMPAKHVAFENFMLLSKKSDANLNFCSNRNAALEQKLISLEKVLHELHELRARQQRLYDRAPCAEAQKAQEETTQKLEQTLHQIAAGKKLKRKNMNILGEQRGAVFSVTSSPIKNPSQNLEVERVKKQFLKEDTVENGGGDDPRSTGFVDYIYLEV